MDAHTKLKASSPSRDGQGGSSERDVFGFFGWFQSFVPLKSAESASLFWTTCALHFFIISAFYCSSPVRDEVGVRTKQSQLPYFFAGTLLGTMVVNPVYSSVTAKYPLSTVVPWLYRGFAIVNLSFFFGMSGDANVAVGWLFYVWVGVFALFNTSLFWSVASNTFDQEAATRLYGLIAAGGTIGQIFGSGAAIGQYSYSFLSKMNSSFVYLAFLTMWAGNQTSSGDRVSFIASLNTYGLLPLCIFVGMSWISQYPTLAGISALKMAYSIFSYSVARPSKEILYTGMDMEARFIGKNLLDLFITRAGDATAAAMFGHIVRKEDVQLGNAEYYTLIHTGIVVAAAWVGLSLYLGHMFNASKRTVHDHTP